MHDEGQNWLELLYNCVAADSLLRDTGIHLMSEVNTAVALVCVARSGAPTLVPKMLKGGVLYVFCVCEFITMWGFMVGNGVKCFGIYVRKPKETSVHLCVGCV